MAREQPGAIDPVVRGIVEEARRYSALDAFQAEYRRAAGARHPAVAGGRTRCWCPPRRPSTPIAQLREDPLALNSRLGRYTISPIWPTCARWPCRRACARDGLPAGITVLGLAWQDHALAEFGRRWQRLGLPLGATGKLLPAAPASRDPAPGMLRVAVVGAHLSGMPLNHQLRSRHAVLVEKTRTAGDYRLYALANTTPPAGLAKRADGAPIEVELWDIPAAFGGFVAEIPPPLGIGTLELEDGRQVKGFICEPRGLEGASDITAHGGWRALPGQPESRRPLIPNSSRSRNVFDTVLIANRGEIAVRAIRTLKRAWASAAWRCIPTPTATPPMREADAAVALGGEKAADSYLRMDLLLAAAQNRARRPSTPAMASCPKAPNSPEAREAAGTPSSDPRPCRSASSA